MDEFRHAAKEKLAALDDGIRKQEEIIRTAKTPAAKRVAENYQTHLAMERSKYLRRLYAKVRLVTAARKWQAESDETNRVLRDFLEGKPPQDSGEKHAGPPTDIKNWVRLEKCGLSGSTASKYAKIGRIKSWRVGRKVWLYRDDVLSARRSLSAVKAAERATIQKTHTDQDG